MIDAHTPTPFQNLQRASHLLATATALAAETADADLKLCRTLTQAVIALTEASQALVDASLTTFNKAP